MRATAEAEIERSDHDLDCQKDGATPAARPENALATATSGGRSGLRA